MPAPLDILNLDGLLSASERGFRDEIRIFVDTEIRPHIARWFAEGVFPTSIIQKFGSAGLLGANITGYGCPGRTAVEYGLAITELEAGDSGLRTFVSVQGSLVMSAIHRWGSEAQREGLLPQLAAGTTVGCFGLTEPTAGSDPSAMKTFARRTADGWSMSGQKRWIGMASIADIAVIWANTAEGIRGFLVPTDTAGFSATPIEPKLSMRASLQCDVLLDDVALPPESLLPGTTIGLRAALSCLNEARYGIVWGAMGAARDSLETALAYAQQRSQFGKPLAGYQLTQQKLVDMLVEVQKGMLLALHLGREKDAGRITPQQISLAKLSNVREAIAICREARTILGGNGITLDYSPFRHASNLESVRTYEGTDEVHTLILGQAITGISAFD